MAGIGVFCAAYLVQSIKLGSLSARFPRSVAVIALALIAWMLVEGARAIIDATRPYEWKDKYPPVVGASPQLVQRVTEKWGKLLK